MDEFQITPECPNCAAAREALEVEAARLERIKDAARAAKKEIFGQWTGKAYELYCEIMGSER